MYGTHVKHGLEPLHMQKTGRKLMISLLLCRK